MVREAGNSDSNVGLPSDMDKSHMLSLIEQKMRADDRKVWSRHLEKTKQPTTLNQLMTWMTIEMKSQMRATVPLRTSRGSLSVHNVNKVNDDGKKNSPLQVLVVQESDSLARSMPEICSPKCR